MAKEKIRQEELSTKIYRCLFDKFLNLQIKIYLTLGWAESKYWSSFKFWQLRRNTAQSGNRTLNQIYHWKINFLFEFQLIDFQIKSHNLRLLCWISPWAIFLGEKFSQSWLMCSMSDQTLIFNATKRDRTWLEWISLYLQGCVLQHLEKSLPNLNLLIAKLNKIF